MNEHELELIDKSIEAYKNTIKFIRSQILDLERKKLKVPEKCPECFTHKFKIATVTKKEVDICEACGCTPCDCDYGNDEEQMWRMWGDI